MEFENDCLKEEFHKFVWLPVYIRTKQEEEEGESGC